MLVSVPSFGNVRRVSRRRLRGFGELPDPAGYTPNSAFYTATADGLKSIPDFYGRYDAARALSREVDAIRGIPEAATLDSTEKALAARIDQGLRLAADNFDWDIGWPVKWDRSKIRWTNLRNGLAMVDGGLNDYLGRVSQLLADARAAVQNRIEAERRAAQEKIEAERAALEAQRRQAEAEAAASLLQATTSQQAVVASQSDLIAAQASAAAEVVQAQKEAQAAMAPRLAGMTYGTVAALGLALAGGVYWMSTQGGKRRR